MKFIAVLTSLCALTKISIAAPATSSKVDAQGDLTWSPTLAAYYEMIAQHIEKARSINLPSTTCDLSKAVMPTAPTPLPMPDGMRLAHVAVGRGVQNYTCNTATPSAAPAPIGAVANLYNASCLAVNAPDVLQLLPNVALQLPTPPADGLTLSPSQLGLSGHHYFVTPTTPVFNFNLPPSLLSSSRSPSLGIAVVKKVANSTAPAGSMRGPAGIGNGAVPWLYLTATDASTGNFAAVYRVNTAGGSAPKTCDNMPSVFSVEYATVYWVYMKK